jgi:hypothetical protein
LLCVYWVSTPAHALPPTWLKKFCSSAASPLGSLLHCEPQKRRYTAGAVSTFPP